MSTSLVEIPVETSGSTHQERALTTAEQVTPVSSLLTEKMDYWGFLEGKDALLYVRLSSSPAPAEKPIDVPSLISQLSRLLPGDRQLQRRARKLAWQLSKGREVTSEWDLIFMSELTSKESCMSDDEFAALYAERTKTSGKRGGRPRRFRTIAAERRGHAERQRRYRAQKLVGVASVTKTPLQVAER
jgi:hypothetical protein